MAPDKRGSGRKGEINAVTQETLASICGEQCSFVFAGIQLRSTEWAGSALARLWRQCPILPYQGPGPPALPSPPPHPFSSPTLPPTTQWLYLPSLFSPPRRHRLRRFSPQFGDRERRHACPRVGTKAPGEGSREVAPWSQAKSPQGFPPESQPERLNATTQAALASFFLHHPPHSLYRGRRKGPQSQGMGPLVPPWTPSLHKRSKTMGGNGAQFLVQYKHGERSRKKKLGGEMKGLCLPLSGRGGLGTRETLLERRRQRARETETGVDVRAPGVT